MEPILKKRQIRILGMIVQSNARADETKENDSARQTEIVRRLTKRNGMREDFMTGPGMAISRIAYSLPYHNLTKSDEEQVNIIIRSAYKAALNLPRFPATEKMDRLGLYNNFAEIREATL
ncbi:hypothetical protein HPB48_003633 [Haemaphysalis longicornis]|uniref:Uncharacterized protein n=1 Tax=Haemaphysalis longicornis TaxID=44386 RepID=A0A9J6F7F2_HAELO|nr:hypothetical protein HPB48_003633 [Haemaphysalis longicornis]